MGPMFASVFQNYGHALAKTLFAVCFSVALAACGGPAREQGQFPAPSVAPPPSTVEVTDDDENEVSSVREEELAEQAINIGLMLPLSGSEEATGRALLRAATMALFDAYDPKIRIIPMDTQADPDVAEARAREAVASGVSVVLGPLLASNVQAVGDILVPAGIPMIGFSNDSSVAEPGRFIMGFLPEAEVKRVVDYAAGQGLSNFGALVPFGRYGSRIRAAFGDSVADAGAIVSAIESYPPDADALFEPVKRLARYDERRDDVRREVRFLRSLRDDVTDEIAEKLEDAEVMEGVDFDAVLVPEGGALMRTLAPLLPFYEIDPNRVKLIGTGLWNNEALLREPPLQGAWFAAPDPDAPKGFLARFEETYAEVPPRLATLAYDAVSLIARFAREPLEDEGDSDAIENEDIDRMFALERFLSPEGFVGVDGLFRFLPDGTTERALAVLALDRDGFQVIDPAPESFPAFGFALKN